MSAAADRGRRGRLAHLIVEQRRARFWFHPVAVRGVTVVVSGLLCSSSGVRWWPLLLVPSLVALWLDLRVGAAGRVPGPWLSCLDVLAALLLVVLPGWVVVDLPFVLRGAAVAAGLIAVMSVAGALFLAPWWFDPAVRSPVWLERLRRAAGPVCAAVTTALLVPAPWPPELTPAVWAGGLVPLFVGARVYGLDHTVQGAVPLIREEGQHGRDQVLRQIHGALSTELRQLEQHARQHRETAPELYERAVNANGGLRETLTLTEEERDTSTSTDTLVASVLTLTRAEGASVAMRVEVDRLGEADRELVRLVLHELVVGALQTGASALEIAVSELTASRCPVRRERRISVEVTDAGRLDDVAVTAAWSPQLEARLADLGGSLTSAPAATYGSRTLTAVWTARP